MTNPYDVIPSKIEEVIDETPTIKTFVLRPERPLEFATGQFVELTVPGVGEAPFTPSSNPAVKEKLDVTIMRVGRVTERLHAMKAGETVAVRGPYGKGYALDEFAAKEILIVGGGVGLAPLRSLLFALMNDIDRYKKVVLRYGARTPADLVYKQALQEWPNQKKLDLLLTVDVGGDGWKGRVGVVTTILDDLPLDIPTSVAVVCGPPVMMKFTTMKLVSAGYRPEQIYLSMEKNMSCGVGKCGHCRLGPYYVCRDGPVLTYDKVQHAEEVWD